jgi:hypothetical protein
MTESQFTPEELETEDLKLHPEKIRRGFKQPLATIPKGESHGMAKLTAKEVREIRALHAGALVSMLRGLARQFSVTRTQIKRIVARRTWKHVE